MTHSIERDIAAVQRVLKRTPMTRNSLKPRSTVKPNNSIEYSKWSSARTRAKQKGLDFDLDVEDIEIPEFCPVLGIKLSEGSLHTRPELDRKDVSKGYVKGNVFVISGRANRLKNDATLDEIRKIAEYALSRSETILCEGY